MTTGEHSEEETSSGSNGHCRGDSMDVGLYAIGSIQGKSSASPETHGIQAKTAKDIWVETRRSDCSSSPPPILPCSLGTLASAQLPINATSACISRQISGEIMTTEYNPSLLPSSHSQPHCAIPRTSENLHVRSANCLGRGCSVLLDRSVDLIELTAEEESSELSHAACNCSSRFHRRWFLPNYKCDSADCANKSLTSRSSKVEISYLQTSDNYGKVKQPNPGPVLESNSQFYSGSSSETGQKIARSSSAVLEPDISNDSVDAENFRIRSCSLTPTVNLAIYESESSSDDNEVTSPPTSEPNLNQSLPASPENSSFISTVSVPLLTHSIPCSPSAAQLSVTSSMTDGGSPICKICHMTSRDGDPLISPCRCSGTMQFIHCGCLMRWLEITSRKSRKPPSCELCQYQYHWHKKFKVRHWQFPHCSRHDKILHAIFFISVMIMIACATITVMCFKQDKGTKVDPDRTELTESEIVTLVCGVLFFLAFFVAMYVEVKARNTIYKLFIRFIYLNQQWYIDEYEKKESAPVSV